MSFTKGAEGRGEQFVDPSFMITQLRERQSEIDKLNLQNPNDTSMNKDGGSTEATEYKRVNTSQTDPFMLLKEVVQMSKYMNPTQQSIGNKTDDFQMKCEMNISNYKAMVQNNFEKMVEEGDEKTKQLANKYNPAAL